MCESFPYRLRPAVPVVSPPGAAVNAAGICAKVGGACAGPRTVVTVECYPGVDPAAVLSLFSPLRPVLALLSDDLALPESVIDDLIRDDLTDDPVFGHITRRAIGDFFDPRALQAARDRVDRVSEGIVLLYGTGASLIHPGDVLVYADITRWEIQLRYRRGMPNWRSSRAGAPIREKYKRGYFVEWRWADARKDELLPSADFYLDMTGDPVLADGEAYRDALRQVARKPFRTVPYFDPGVWGGDWMKRRFGLPENGLNYAWSFDGVPEENSLLLSFGGVLLETPALNLVHFCPRELLGARVFQRFGAEFPIRFDMLDTVRGQNLSLQVHPLTEYIRQRFGMEYTQDESYYILDAEGNDPCVYLGLKDGIDPAGMMEALRAAQRGDAPFPAADYINRVPVRPHDHLLIPAGTVHGAGAGTMVLEISATPYIFTFKLWDWGRVDLDGKPRPVHLDHGRNNIQWDRTASWVGKNLVNAVTLLEDDARGTVERTGLHELEFLDTFRVTTESEREIRRNGSVHVLNLVRGKRALLLSPSGSFEPFELRYAETCILPEAAGAYAVSSPDGEPVTVILACVRENPPE